MRRVASLLLMLVVLVVWLAGCQVQPWSMAPPTSGPGPLPKNAPGLPAGPTGAPTAQASQATGAPSQQPQAPQRSEAELLLEKYGYAPEALARTQQEALATAKGCLKLAAEALKHDQQAKAEALMVEGRQALAAALANRPESMLALQLSKAKVQLDAGDLGAAKAALELAKAMLQATPDLPSAGSLEGVLVLAESKLTPDTLEEANQQLEAAEQVLASSAAQPVELEADSNVAAAQQALKIGQKDIAVAYLSAAQRALKQAQAVKAEAGPEPSGTSPQATPAKPAPEAPTAGAQAL